MPPTIDPDVGCIVPDAGEWPVDPQQDQPLEDGRLWVDGCFDFFHHGHAGVMLQSRRLGSALIVGLHSDEEILANKGPTVMRLAERVAAVEACRFATKAVPHAPYVTSLPWIGHYGCRFVTHGDDITSDADGNDCYRFVKRAGRMKIVPRTPGISTTDLVGRMLLCTRDHFIRSLTAAMEGRDGAGDEEERRRTGREMARRITEYAAAPNGFDPYVCVYSVTTPDALASDERRRFAARGDNPQHGRATIPVGYTFTSMVSGRVPAPGQRLVYVDGGFDLFSSGHIAFLRTVSALEDEIGRQSGWFDDSARRARIAAEGEDYGPAYVVAGVHDDEVINAHRGVNYPIMNIFERGLCVLQCRYVHGVIFGAPYIPSDTYLATLPFGRGPDVVYHGPTDFMRSVTDPYADARKLGIFQETPSHDFQDVNSEHIVRRILDNRAQYEERQRKKGIKGVGEEAQRRREAMEQQIPGAVSEGTT